MLRNIFKSLIVIFIILLSLPLGHKTTQAVEHDGKKSVSEFYNEQKESGSEKDETNTLTPEDNNNPAIDTQFGVLDFFNLLFALGLVLLLLFVTLRFIKKKNQSYGITKTVMNLGGTSLGANRSVQLVKVGNRILVVGVGEDIQLLKEIDSEEEIDQIISQQQKDDEQMLQPLDVFSKIIEQVKKSKHLNQHNKNSQDRFKTLLAKQLSDLKNGRKKLLEELDKKGNKGNE